MNSSIRQRFDRLRQAMGWSWKDIDTITGRKNARTNIAKRVPAWAHLAIEAHEGYEVLLRHTLIDLINAKLGRQWSYHLLGGGVIHFRKEVEQTGDDTWIDLRFEPGCFSLESSTSQVYELAERLKHLFPAITDPVKSKEGTYLVHVPIRFIENPEATLEAMAKRSRAKFTT